MFNTKSVLSVLAILAMGVPSLGLAQDSRYDTDPDTSYYSTQTDKRSLADKLDDFGQAIFGGILPKEEKPKETVRTPRTTTKPATPTVSGTLSPSVTSAGRAGSAMNAKPKPSLQSILGLTPQETATADHRSIASPPSTSLLPSRST